MALHNVCSWCFHSSLDLYISALMQYSTALSIIRCIRHQVPCCVVYSVFECCHHMPTTQPPMQVKSRNKWREDPGIFAASGLINGFILFKLWISNFWPKKFVLVMCCYPVIRKCHVYKCSYALSRYAFTIIGNLVIFVCFWVLLEKLNNSPDASKLSPSTKKIFWVCIACRKCT